MTPTTGTHREKGAAMLLAFLAILVLVVVMMQISVSSVVDRSIAYHSLEEMQYEYAAQASFHIAQSILIKDSQDDEEQAGETGQSDSSDAMGNDRFGSGGSGGGDGMEEEGLPPTDSLNDDWADPQSTKEQFAGGIEVRIRIIDEDRKLNILNLVAEDASFRDQYHEIFVRLLDTFREDSKHDLSKGDAGDLVDGFERWIRGDDREEEFPVYPQSTEDNSDDNMVWSESVFKEDDESNVIYPLSLDEFVMVENMDEFILHGFMEDDVYVPGLEDVVTVYSNVRIDPDALQPDEDEEDAFGSVPFGEESEEEEEEEASESVEVDAANEGRATETNQGRVNVNTAPLPVLSVLMDSDRISYSVFEEIDEFRKLIFDEEFLQDEDYAEETDSDFATDEDVEKEVDETKEEIEEDFVFKNPDEVIPRVEGFSRSSLNVGQSERDDLADLLSVRSHVFTIIVELRNSNKQGGSVSLSDGSVSVPPDRLYRAVVWRRQQSEGEFQCVTLVPLHPWAGVVPPDTEEYRTEYPLGF